MNALMDVHARKCKLHIQRPHVHNTHIQAHTHTGTHTHIHNIRCKVPKQEAKTRMRTPSVRRPVRRKRRNASVPKRRRSEQRRKWKEAEGGVEEGLAAAGEDL